MKGLIWLNTFPRLWIKRHRLVRVNMETLDKKAPYLLFVNHNSYLDYKVAAKSVFPRSAANIVALDAYIKREHLVRWIGGIGKRKFVSDASLVRQILYVLKTHKIPLIMYPEAHYSLVGLPSSLPSGLAKLVKMSKVPLVILINHGHHIAKPHWHHHRHVIKTESVITQVVTKDEVKSLSIAEIEQRLQNAFDYNDYEWLINQNIKIKSKHRAEGLHHVLFQCPHCLKEGAMTSKKTVLKCEHCQTTYDVDEQYRLSSPQFEMPFFLVSDWFHWQKKHVQHEVLKPDYFIRLDVDVALLPDAKGFIPVGKGVLEHSQKGFKLTFTLNNYQKTIKKTPRNQYALHVEFSKASQKISFSTDTQTYFMTLLTPGISATKLYLATEALHNMFCPNKH